MALRISGKHHEDQRDDFLMILGQTKPLSSEESSCFMGRLHDGEYEDIIIGSMKMADSALKRGDSQRICSWAHDGHVRHQHELHTLWQFELYKKI